MKNDTTNLHNVGFADGGKALSGTCHPGMTLYWKSYKYLGLGDVLDSGTVPPGNRGSRRSFNFAKLLAMAHIDKCCITDLLALWNDHKVSEGMTLPSANAAFRLLEHMGGDQSMVEALLDGMCPRLMRGVPEGKELWLDIDEYFIECDKEHDIVLMRHPEQRRGQKSMGFARKVVGFATSVPRVGDTGVVLRYRRRGEDCENRIKELRTDFGGGRLPSAKVSVNRGWLFLNAIAYNLAKAMMRLMFKGSLPRMKRFRDLVYSAIHRMAWSGRRAWAVTGSRDHARLRRWDRCLRALVAP